MHRVAPMLPTCRRFVHINLAARGAPTSTHIRRFTSRRTQVTEHIIRCPIDRYDIPQSPFLAHYVMENWHKFSSKTALINSETGSKLSYGELQSQIAKVGSALKRSGFGKGDLATIISANSPEFCIVYLAAISIGMTVSTLNPAYVQGELEHALNDSESKILFFSPSLTQLVNSCLPNCPTIKRAIVLGSAVGHQSLADLLEDDGKAFPENVSYDSKQDTIALLYSSGTSGKPKGVMLTSHCLVANMVQFSNPDFFDTQQDQVNLAVLPFFHIFGQNGIFLSGLRYGITIVTMSKFQPEAFLENVQRYRPTHVYLVPPIMLFLGTHPVVDKYDLTSIKEMIHGAAPASPVIIKQLQERFGKHANLCQGFGMTELSPASHINPKHRRKPTTSGIVLPHTEFKMRDIETNELLPPYKEGELCVKGPQMMKGYHKNETATRETIIDGWLHTGDIGYYDEDGYLTITDRIKELIKVKGFQVAPAELENLLLGHPAVQDAAVIGILDDMAGELPRAYVVLKPGAKTTEQDIMNYVKDKAAPYKQLKGGVEFRTEIPKAPSGKILRRILRDEFRQNR